MKKLKRPQRSHITIGNRQFHSPEQGTFSRNLDKYERRRPGLRLVASITTLRTATGTTLVVLHTDKEAAREARRSA